MHTSIRQTIKKKERKAFTVTLFAAYLNEQVFITVFSEQNTFITTAQQALVFSHPICGVPGAYPNDKSGKKAQVIGLFLL